MHLTFGLLIHGAREQYEHARSAEQDHETSLARAVRWSLEQTWDAGLGRGWASDHPTKNRLTLVRSVVWYLDEFGAGDSMETIQLADGKPAIEVSFKFDSGLRAAATDEQIFFCGHLDRIARFSDQLYVVDIKTTGSTISSKFFSDFTPGNQFSMYALAGQVGLALPVRGVIVDGMQIAAGFTRSLRGLVNRSNSQLNEWLAEAGWWTRQMSDCAERADWPQNDKNCHMYGGCQFRSVCSRSPGARQIELDQHFTKRVWDPTVARGDI